MRTIPNKLTILRLIIVPIFAILFLSDIIPYYYRCRVVFFVFLFGMLTDFLDGFIARKYKCETVFGIIVDPVADKILLITAIILLVFAHRINIYVAVFLVVRDVFVSGIRIVSARYNTSSDKFIKSLEPSKIGKLKTLVETVLVLYLLLELDIIVIENIFISLTVFLSLWSVITLIIESTSVIKLAYYDYIRNIKDERLGK